jgi:hypothetical protein
MVRQVVADLLAQHLVISDRHLPSLGRGPPVLHVPLNSGAVAEVLINWSGWLTSPS